MGYNDRIVQLLQLYLVGEITEDEKRELEEWCGKEEENRRFLEQICREGLFAEEHPLYQKIDDRKALQVFEKQTRKGSRRYVGNWWKYAAVLLLPLLIAGIWRWTYREEKVTTVAKADVKIRPGYPQAVLILDDGRRVALQEREEGEFSVEKGVKATREKDQLVYSTTEENADIGRFNELEVPRGGEYKVVLADGTVVYLNSATRIKYPVVFGEKERKVSLSGEAYFEVTKDRERPFLVEVGDVEVKVYGTSFNIHAYGDGSVQTVLVEGRVGLRVLDTEEECMIEPGQMAEFRQGNSGIEVKEVNTALYTDWKNGIFRFENQRLEDILTVLSYWYDVDVFYQMPSVKELHFSGYMERYKDFGVILNAITLATGVQFSVQGRVVTVSK